MATAPQKAYLGDRYDYIDWLNRWGKKPFHRLVTFQDGVIGDVAQKGLNGNTYTDCWDGDAGQSRYSDEVLFHGRQVCRCDLPQGSVGQLSFGGTVSDKVHLGRGQTHWAQSTVWMPSSFDLDESIPGGGAMKYMRTSLRSPDHEATAIAQAEDPEAGTVWEGTGHADIYLHAPSFNNNVFKYTLEAHTSKKFGHATHNSNIRFQPRDEWEFPRDQWVNVQVSMTHDLDYLGPDPESRCVLRTWVGDTLINETRGTETWAHTMLTDDAELYFSQFITYFNANYNPQGANYDPNGGEHGVTKAMHLYIAEYEITNVKPTYTDEFGNPKLPPRI